MVKEKKGMSFNSTILLWFLIGLIAVWAILFISGIGRSNISAPDFIYSTPSEILNFAFPNTDGAAARAITFFGTILQFIIGNVPTTSNAIGSSIDVIQGGPLGALIVTICIWGMMLLGFGDIFRNLSFFSDKISWWIAVFLTIAISNMGLLGKWVITATEIMGIIGISSIYLGLLFSFVVFLIIEFGITPLGPWLMRRKAMQEASKYKISAEAGGEKISGTITSLGNIGDALRNMGKRT